MLSIKAAMASSYDHALVILKVEPVATTAKEDAEKIRELAHKLADILDAPSVRVTGFSPNRFQFGFGFDNVLAVNLEGGIFAHTGNLDDYVIATGTGTLSTGRGDDEINAMGDDLVIYAGDGDDVIFSAGNAILNGGDGNDTIHAQGLASVDAGEGNDQVSLLEGGAVVLGDGNDSLDSGGPVSASGGNGDDGFFVAGGSVVYGDAGNDTVLTGSGSIVDGGTGKDWLRGQAFSNIDGGDGSDMVMGAGGSVLTGGNGDDLIVALSPQGDDEAGSIVDGGTGNDIIQADRDSLVFGGKGNDTIHITGANSIISYIKGDGSDLIRSADDVTVAIAGYSAKDATIATQDDKITVTFARTGETLTFDLAAGINAQLQFGDGSQLEVTGAAAAKTFEEIDPVSDRTLIGKAFVMRSTSYSENGVATIDEREWTRLERKGIADYLPTFGT